MKTLLNCILTVLFLASCDALSEDEKSKPSVSVENFEVTIAENPSQDQVLGTVNATIKDANNNGFQFVNENQSGDLSNYLSMDRNTGQISVSDPSHFDFEKQVTYIANANVQVFNSSDEMAEADFTITIHLTDVLELSIQGRLDDGQTPLEIYNSNNSLLDSLYGKEYQGGLIFYFDTSDGTGLVAHKDEDVVRPWDFNQFNDLIELGGTNQTLGSGVSNTDSIVTKLGDGTYAAKICSDLVVQTYTDWYLPSLDELHEMYDGLHDKGFGNFSNEKYWSSTESGATSAWSRDFAVKNGAVAVTTTKAVGLRFRAGRSF